jgi:catechol 2,3-dioxygenase-like lactoylglutathione lyase family enzyme
MIEHTGVFVRNYKKGKQFYSKLLAPLSYKLKRDYPGAAGFMEGGHTSFWVIAKKKPQPSHVAFLAKSKKAVQKFHTAGIRAGGKDNGAAGFRTDYGPTYYAAFILDLDDNNIEACYFGARAPRR